MHAIVVHESAWGNTRAVAEAIAAGLGAGGELGRRLAERTPPG